MRYERDLIRPVPQRRIEDAHDELLNAVAALIDDSNRYFASISRATRMLKAVSLEIDTWRLGRNLPDAETAPAIETEAA